MSKHSPSPWRTEKFDWREIVDANGLMVADIRTPPDKNGREDALLIAAAPELLKAAKDVLRDVKTLCGVIRRQYGHHSQESAYADKRYHNLIEAIEKAEGN